MSSTNKLTNKHRLVLANLAVTTFINPDLKSAFDSSLSAAHDALVSDLTALQPDMAILAKYGNAKLITTPLRVSVSNTFTFHPDRSHSIWNTPFKTIWNTPFKTKTHYYRPQTLITTSLERSAPLLAPTELFRFYEDASHISTASYDERIAIPLFPTYYAAIKEAESALDALISDHNDLTRAMIEVIGSCATFDTLVELWPECSHLRPTLFPSDSPKSTALTVLTTDMRKRLCSSMKSRGVTGSVICATS